MGCDNACLVSMFIESRGWALPASTTLDMHELWPQILDVPIGGGEDFVTWIPTEGTYSCHSAWDAIHLHSPTVTWVTLIWYRGANQQHAFCAWRSLLHGLPTHRTCNVEGLPWFRDIRSVWML